MEAGVGGAGPDRGDGRGPGRPRTIRLSAEADRVLRRLAKTERRSQSKMVEVAILAYRARRPGDGRASPEGGTEARG